MNEIKYEAVFGLQELFNGAQNDIVAVRLNDYQCISYGYLTQEKLDALSVAELKAIPVVAMRRIISTPAWTVADHKAVGLPEVGCRIYVPMMHEEQNVIYSSEKVIVSISDNEGAVTRTEVGSIDRIKPIESPEEKAARLREEWCRKCTSQFYPRGSNGFPEMIYDALLSGDLHVPVKGE